MPLNYLALESIIYKQQLMGITVHYRGMIDKVANIEKLTTEMANISNELKWKYDIIDDEKQKVKGIIIKPHKKSEPLSILFNSHLNLISWAALSLKQVNDESAHFVSIKTQYAPLNIHISVIKLLKYIQSKYISNLKVVDEGDYWNTMDESLLKEKMDYLDSRLAKKPWRTSR